MTINDIMITRTFAIFAIFVAIVLLYPLLPKIVKTRDEALRKSGILIAMLLLGLILVEIATGAVSWPWLRLF